VVFEHLDQKILHSTFSRLQVRPSMAAKSGDEMPFGVATDSITGRSVVVVACALHASQRALCPCGGDE
jgi:hypothetical protein